MAAAPKAAPKEVEAPAGVYIDGHSYTVEDLTYRERRELRKVVAELLDLSPEEARSFDVMAAAEEDALPVFVWVIRRRTDPEYGMEAALDLKPSDLEAPVDPPKRRASK